MSNPARPLEGIRVIEMGQLLAGPFTGTILSYFGAEVIKVEPPGGDPVRSWGEQVDGRSLWWSSHARNKKSVSLNLKDPEARPTAAELLRHPFVKDCAPTPEEEAAALPFQASWAVVVVVAKHL